MELRGELFLIFNRDNPDTGPHWRVGMTGQTPGSCLSTQWLDSQTAPSAHFYKLVLSPKSCALWCKKLQESLASQMPRVPIKVSRWLSLYLSRTRGLPCMPSSPPESQVLLRVAKALLSVLPASGCRLQSPHSPFKQLWISWVTHGVSLIKHQGKWWLAGWRLEASSSPFCAHIWKSRRASQVLCPLMPARDWKHPGPHLCSGTFPPAIPADLHRGPGWWHFLLSQAISDLFQRPSLPSTETSFM